MTLLRHEQPTVHGKIQRVDDEKKLSTTVRVVALPAILMTLVFGLYIGLHGQLTPGGGQGLGSWIRVLAI